MSGSNNPRACHAAAAPRLILASRSPRRLEMLRLLGLVFEVIIAEIEENFVQGEGPGEAASRLARLKAEAVASSYPEGYVLAADTVVALPQGEGSAFVMLDKPGDRAEAVAMLEMLSGREHLVVSGFSICCGSKELVNRAVTTRVLFAELTPDDIMAYIDTGEPFDKAGGYGIQGVGQFFVSSISGSYSNVVGLPLAEVVCELRRFGIWKPQMIGATV